MVLEEYIDKGIYFKQLMALAEMGLEVKLLNGTIQVGNSGAIGVINTNLTYDSIEKAISKAFAIKVVL